MIVSNEEKNRTIIPFIFVAIIAPILTCLVIPLYESYVSESLSRFDSPFLDMTVQMAMHNQIIGMILNYVFAKSPMFLFALLLAVSIVILLKTPSEKRVAVMIVAFAISCVIFIYSVLVILNPGIRYLGDLTYAYGSDYPAIGCLIYAALLVYAGIARKAN